MVTRENPIEAPENAQPAQSEDDKVQAAAAHRNASERRE
jgi:hypothetical protein